MTEQEEKLEKLYAQLPTMECKGLCQECCGPIGMSPAEFKRIHDQVGDRIQGRAMVGGVGIIGKNYTCPLLKDGKCTVYKIRPLICRIWGATKELQCPHGCKPSRVMTKLESHKLLHLADSIR